MNELIDEDDSLLSEIINTMSKYWPSSNTYKEEVYIELLYIIMPNRTVMMNKKDLHKFIQLVERIMTEGKPKIIHCVFELCKDKDMISYFQENNNDLKIFLKELEMIKNTNWNREIRKDCCALLDILKLEIF